MVPTWTADCRNLGSIIYFKTWGNNLSRLPVIPHNPAIGSLMDDGQLLTRTSVVSMPPGYPSRGFKHLPAIF
eukprot:513651-Amorphochlora_amoeboformis.AAC.1